MLTLVFWIMVIFIEPSEELLFDGNMFGQEFVLAFRNNVHNNDTTRLRILNNLKDKVTISIYNAEGQEVDKNGNNSEIIERFLQRSCAKIFVHGDCFVKITSKQNVKISVLDALDGEIFYFLLPLNKLGNEYLLETTSLHGNHTCDLLTVYPSTFFNISTTGVGQISFINMTQFCRLGECTVPVQNVNSIFQLSSKQDITGVSVKSNKPFAVFCGGLVSAGRTFLNQLPPTGMYGSSYQTWMTLFNGFVYVTSRCNDTHVQFYGSQNLTFDLDSRIHCKQRVLAQEVFMISSNKPIMVMQSWSMRHFIHRLTLGPLVTANHSCEEHESSSLTISPSTVTQITTDQFTSSTSGSASIMGSSSQCLCPCPSKVVPSVHQSDLADKLQKLRELSLNKSTLSSTIRRKTSAYDNRPSAQGIGIIGVVLLCAVVILIVVLDMPNLLNQFRVVRHNMCGDLHTHYNDHYGPKMEWKRKRLIHVRKTDSTVTIAGADTEQDDC